MLLDTGNGTRTQLHLRRRGPAAGQPEGQARPTGYASRTSTTPTTTSATSPRSTTTRRPGGRRVGTQVGGPSRADLRLRRPRPAHPRRGRRTSRRAPRTDSYRSTSRYDTIHNITTKNQTHELVSDRQRDRRSGKTQLRLRLHLRRRQAARAQHRSGRTPSRYDANGNQISRSPAAAAAAAADLGRGEPAGLQPRERASHDAAADPGVLRQRRRHADDVRYVYDDQGNRVVKDGDAVPRLPEPELLDPRNQTEFKHVYVGDDQAGHQDRRARPHVRGPASTTPTPTTSARPASSPTTTAGLSEHSSTSRPARPGSASTRRSPSPHQFTGKELDPETGLYYYGARYYDPRTPGLAVPRPGARALSGRQRRTAASTTRPTSASTPTRTTTRSASSIPTAGG